MQARRISIRAPRWRAARGFAEARGAVLVRRAAGKILDCRGIAARDQQPDLRPVRGEMLMVHAPELTLSRPVRLLHPRFPCYIVPRGAGAYMIGATMVESGRSGPITARAVMELLSAAYTLHPAFAEAEVGRRARGCGLPMPIISLRSVSGRMAASRSTGCIAMAS